MKIHREGLATISLVFVLIVGLNYLFFKYLENVIIADVLCAITVIFFFFIVSFFRIPKRKHTFNDNAIVSPADGKVVVIENTTEKEHFKDERIQVSIFMSPLNVHVNRYPIDGKVQYHQYHPGEYLVAWHPKSSELNERNTVVVENEKGSILMRQIAGKLARKICWYCKPGDEAKQNEEFGFIKFGSRVDLFLPLDAKIEVNMNQKVKGGVTTIATFK